MKIEKDEALRLAKEFATQEYKNTDWPLNVNDISIKLSNGSWFGLSDRHWSVIISTKCDDPNVAVIDPDHVIVLVDTETGETKWFPIM
ncbi:hypothetical protein NBRC116583_37870 [Arenicella sp. 4NH20-0111]|uniref:hypothetical protein n=1 Tax=Arenicella sp. 4NH20-0111 TaxID=3127648 RepID=UPI00310AA77B